MQTEALAAEVVRKGTGARCKIPSAGLILNGFCTGTMKELNSYGSRCSTVQIEALAAEVVRKGTGERRKILSK